MCSVLGIIDSGNVKVHSIKMILRSAPILQTFYTPLLLFQYMAFLHLFNMSKDIGPKLTAVFAMVSVYSNEF